MNEKWHRWNRAIISIGITLKLLLQGLLLIQKHPFKRPFKTMLLLDAMEQNRRKATVRGNVLYDTKGKILVLDRSKCDVSLNRSQFGKLLAMASVTSSERITGKNECEISS